MAPYVSKVPATAAEEGGVAWTGPLDTVARANLWLRTASRVIVRVAEFKALTFFELERHSRKRHADCRADSGAGWWSGGKVGSSRNVLDGAAKMERR